MSDSPGEFEFEPIPGLPEELPPGEHILWQGAPDWRSLARHAFHVRGLAAYFAIMLAARVALGVFDGQGLGETLASSAGLVALAIVCLGLVGLIAWLNARATVYTITSERVVLRIGVAITVSLNLPHRRIESAELRLHDDGTGDIPLGVEGSAQLGFALLWPHARAWCFGDRAQPTLRSIPDAAHVAELLTGALAATLRATSTETRSTIEADDARSPVPASAPREPAVAVG